MANANRQFQVTDPATLQALVRTQPLATLVIAHDGALHANHIPLFLDPHQGPHGTLLGHVARANGVWPLLPQQAVAVFHGPQAYISPSWYPSKAVDGKQVPTWNYAAVLADLHHQAHAACFLANSVKTQIDCAPVLQTEGA